MDLASISTILACSLRPPIYLICQPTLRREIFAIIKQLFSLKTNKETVDNLTRTALISGILYSMADQWDGLPALSKYICKILLVLYT